MSGPFALGDVDPEQGRRTGARTGTELAMHATIRIPDVEHFEADPNHEGQIEGTIDFPPMGMGMPSTGGRFNLFSPEGDAARRRMVYELAFTHESEDYYLAGFKDVHDDPGIDAWSDTTTLFTRLYRGRDANGSVVGAGVLRLGVDEMEGIISTLGVTGAEGVGARARAVAAGGRLVRGHLWTSSAALAPKPD
jgi:cholesterol oxidase